jgi:hypothetical protein
MLKLPYLKQVEKICHFIIWLVDGNYIRKNIDEEFTNFGQHFRFKFIPKNEFWIDKEFSEGELNFYIDHLLVENRLMASGKSYEEAITNADKIEKRERSKSLLFKEVISIKNKLSLIKKIHKKILKEYAGKIKIWLVKGELVRDLFLIDFTEGGHDKVYPFVPKKEIWIDDDLSSEERKFVILHELYERNLMCRKLNYDKAHRASSKIEYYCRHYPEKLREIMIDEIKKIC